MLVFRANNDRPYLYRSFRRSGRVTSEYRAAGSEALLLHALETVERAKRDCERQRQLRERDALDELERAVDGLAERARRQANEALTRQGYHQYKRGEWRKRRVSNRDASRL
jgi:hypothetical protein